MQSRRNAHAAKRFLMKLMKRWGVPRVLVTDKLRSYGVAVRDLCPSVDHRSDKGLNNLPAMAFVAETPGIRRIPKTSSTTKHIPSS